MKKIRCNNCRQTWWMDFERDGKFIVGFWCPYCGNTGDKEVIE